MKFLKDLTVNCLLLAFEAFLMILFICLYLLFLPLFYLIPPLRGPRQPAMVDLTLSQPEERENKSSKPLDKPE